MCLVIPSCLAHVGANPGTVLGTDTILSPQFNNIKEMIAADVAEHFHAAGFNVLLYDPRTIGASDGLPRNEPNPARNVEDYHDALTFLKAQPSVDPKRIAFWGYSFSGLAALCAAALDKRARAVIAVSPVTVWHFTKWTKVLAKAMKDRESRLAGNKPVKLPMVTEDGQQPAGFAVGLEDEDVYNIITRSAEVQPSFVNETTLSTYYHIAAFQPFGLLPFVSPTPVMVVTGENDVVSPAELQRTKICDVFQEPKKLLMVPQKGHMNVLSGQEGPEVLDAQVAFLKEVLGV